MRRIYTKTGDKGKTSLYDGTRVNKSDQIINVLGTIDELNASLGVLMSFVDKEILHDKFEQKQKELMSMASMIALSKSKIKPSKNFELTEANLQNLENEIDEWEKQLPPLENFILPGGERAASLAHFSRTICRRLEREMVLQNAQNTIDPILLKYINRLSDWLFVLARILNSGNDIVWEVK